MDDDSTRLERLATAAHGASAMIHVLGLHYNLAEDEKDASNWSAAVLHGAALTFSAISVYQHVTEDQP